MMYPANILTLSPSSTPCIRHQRSKILLWDYFSLTPADMIQSPSTFSYLQMSFCPTDPFQIPWNTLLKLLQLNLCWEGSITQVDSTTCWPLFGFIRTFHMGRSTLLKLLHPAESFTTFNYFTWKVNSKNLFSRLIHSPHFKTVCMNESPGGICKKGKLLTYHKLTHHATKSTKYSQLQSATYCY